jgi:hypothetical protein
VFQLGLVLLSLFLSLSSSLTENIEKAFLQNNPRLFYPLFSAEQPINISLPEPISFSDQLTREQSFFLFQNIFSTYTTFEFFPEPNGQSPPHDDRFIFRARWSFLNKNKNQFVFLIFFYIRRTPGASRAEDFWKITEIKAEKL